MLENLPIWKSYKTRATKGVVRDDPSKVAEVATWTLPPSRTVDHPTNKSLWIQPDPTLGRRMRELIEAAAPTAAEAYNKRLQPVAEQAQNRWPVLTGLSRASIVLTYQFLEANTITGSIEVRAPYAYYVRRGRSAKHLIFEPAKLAADQMATDMGDQLSEIM